MQSKTKMQNKLFTEAEIESLNQRLKGDRKDSTGIFSARVKPKIIELLEVWIPKQKELRELIKPMEKKNRKSSVNEVNPPKKEEM